MFESLDRFLFTSPALSRYGMYSRALMGVVQPPKNLFLCGVLSLNQGIVTAVCARVVSTFIFEALKFSQRPRVGGAICSLSLVIFSHHRSRLSAVIAAAADRFRGGGGGGGGWEGRRDALSFMRHTLYRHCGVVDCSLGYLLLIAALSCLFGTKQRGKHFFLFLSAAVPLKKFRGHADNNEGAPQAV